MNTRDPVTVRDFLREVREYAAHFVRLEPRARFVELRWVVSAIRTIPDVHDRAGVLSALRDAMRRERGMLAISRAIKLPPRRCEVCAIKLPQYGPNVCRGCRRRLEQLEGADPVQMTLPIGKVPL